MGNETFPTCLAVSKAFRLPNMTVWRRLKAAKVPGPPYDAVLVGNVLSINARASRATAVLSPPPAKPDATVADFKMPPTLAQLEDRIRRATDVTEAETLSKQVRSLKVLQEVAERDGKLIDAEAARGEIRSVLTMMQVALMGQPRTLAPSLFGLDTLEIEAVLEGRFTEMLGELRRGLENAFKPETLERNMAGTDTAGAVASEPMGGAAPGNDAAADESSGALAERE